MPQQVPSVVPEPPLTLWKEKQEFNQQALWLKQVETSSGTLLMYWAPAGSVMGALLRRVGALLPPPQSRHHDLHGALRSRRDLKHTFATISDTSDGPTALRETETG